MRRLGRHPVEPSIAHLQRWLIPSTLPEQKVGAENTYGLTVYM